MEENGYPLFLFPLSKLYKLSSKEALIKFHGCPSGAKARSHCRYLRRD